MTQVISPVTTGDGTDTRPGRDGVFSLPSTHNKCFPFFLSSTFMIPKMPQELGLKVMGEPGKPKADPDSFWWVPPPSFFTLLLLCPSVLSDQIPWPFVRWSTEDVDLNPTDRFSWVDGARSFHLVLFHSNSLLPATSPQERCHQPIFTEEDTRSER